MRLPLHDLVAGIRIGVHNKVTEFVSRVESRSRSIILRSPKQDERATVNPLRERIDTR